MSYLTFKFESVQEKCYIEISFETAQKKCIIHIFFKYVQEDFDIKITSVQEKFYVQIIFDSAQEKFFVQGLKSKCSTNILHCALLPLVRSWLYWNFDAIVWCWWCWQHWIEGVYFLNSTQKGGFDTAWLFS